jgi:hypothetical protein
MEIPCMCRVSHDTNCSIAGKEESSLLESHAALHCVNSAFKRRRSRNRSSTNWSFVAARVLHVRSIRTLSVADERPPSAKTSVSVRSGHIESAIRRRV